MSSSVVAVHASGIHGFSKQTQDGIVLLAGLGVEGDAHCGRTVKHRSRVAKNPDQPNLRQVHLIHTELFEQMARQGHVVRPGELGENISTQGIDLLGLPRGSELHIGAEAVVTITGLRNPCGQIENFQAGLLAQVLEKKSDGTLIRKAGVMGVVTRGGRVRQGDPVRVCLPPEPREALDWV